MAGPGRPGGPGKAVATRSAELKLSYFPGCLLKGSAREYDLANRAVAWALSVELVELTDWNCCGALMAASFESQGATALCQRNLRQVTEEATDLFCPCPHCYSSFARTLAGGDQTDGSVRLRNVLDVFADEQILERLVEKRVDPLTDLKMAAYYGCKLSRPQPEVGELAVAGRAAAPGWAVESRALERVIEACGATPVEWSAGADCCGAALGVARTDVALELLKSIFAAALAAEAEALVVACPLCHLNLDLHQHLVSQRLRRSVDLPVFFVTELMAVALDLKHYDEWLERHVTSPLSLFMSFIEAQEDREYWGEEGPPGEGEGEETAAEEATTEAEVEERVEGPPGGDVTVEESKVDVAGAQSQAAPGTPSDA